MEKIIHVSNYEDIDSVNLSGNIIAELSYCDKVILDFKGILEIDPEILKNLIERIFNRFNYEEIKMRLGYKNLEPKVRKAFQCVLGEILNRR